MESNLKNEDDKEKMNVYPTPVKKIMERSFLDYAMSVITDRALPDVRDGLKPVHRRILFAMFDSGNTFARPYRKSARMVGDVIGKYHPHGDVSVYDAAVRMAQPFSMNHVLIDGQGNFGSVDGDNPAAMRYTELRLTPLAGLMFDDIGKDTVVFTPNYDGSESEPSVITTPFPTLVVNGTDGIAVGMATSIPPHNLRDVAAVVHLLSENPDADATDIYRILKAPDFPTGGIVYNTEGLLDAITTGRGKIRVRAKWHAEERNRGSRIVVEEIPYQVNKANLVASIADLVRNKEIEDIVALRDESSKEGMRIAIDLRAGADPEVVFAQLATKTNMDVAFSYNATVLDRGTPRLMGLQAMLLAWMEFRRETILKRYTYERQKAFDQLHLLRGLLAAMDQLDAVIQLIRSSKSTESNKNGLMALLNIDETQAKAILDMRLQKLSGFELESLRADHQKVTDNIASLTDIIDHPQRIEEIMLEELDAVAHKYGKDRQTEIGEGFSSLVREDLIPREEVLIAMTRTGYVKRMPVSVLSAQNRGTRGKKAISMGDGDDISALIQCHSHDMLLLFTVSGQALGAKAWQMPEGSPTSQGRHLRNVFDGLDEEIAALVQVPENTADLSVVAVTKNGQVKKTTLDEYAGATRKGGVAGIKLDSDDALVDIFTARPKDHLILVSSSGKAIRFSLDDVRSTGRVTGGVCGMRLGVNEHILGAMVVPSDGNDLETITVTDDDGSVFETVDTTAMDSGRYLICIGEKGVGKRTSISEFRLQNRAGKGMIAFKASKKTGALVAALGLYGVSDLVLFASNGVSNKIHAEDVREAGRNTSGVYLMNLDDGAVITRVVTAVRMPEDSEEVGPADNS